MANIDLSRAARRELDRLWNQLTQAVIAEAVRLSGTPDDSSSELDEVAVKAAWRTVESAASRARRKATPRSPRPSMALVIAAVAVGLCMYLVVTWVGSGISRLERSLWTAGVVLGISLIGVIVLRWQVAPAAWRLVKSWWSLTTWSLGDHVRVAGTRIASVLQPLIHITRPGFGGPSGFSWSRAPGSTLTGSYMTLRKAIGWIGVCLPFAVFLGNWAIFSKHVLSCVVPVSNKLPDSLSGYYYSHMRDAFVGGMWAAGVFLFFYRGHDKLERWATNFAGLFAIGIALFPTMPPSSEILQTNSCSPATPVVLQPAPHGFAIGVVHLVCLCGLMTMITVMAWRFTREYSNDEIDAMTEDDREIELNRYLKYRNNKIYWGCVVAMLLAGALALAQEFAFSQSIKNDAPWLFYAETVAFLAFGTAWFVKGRALMGLRNTARRARSVVRHDWSQEESPIATGH